MADAAQAIKQVRAYHQATKHHTSGYAPSPGFLDWDSQPNPFRRYLGAPLIPLPLVGGDGLRDYHDLYRAEGSVAAAPANDSLGLMLELALGLSAWKTAGPDRWLLRNNPSSGNLHPTEGYLVLWRQLSDELLPGVYHYAPFEHALERRALLAAETAAQLQQTSADAFGAIALTSIPWREEWKYGSRAFRYCQHDVGHAVAAVRFASGLLGWHLGIDPCAGDDALSACLGIDRDADFSEDAEREHPDLIALLGTSHSLGPTPSWPSVAEALGDWRGSANLLSPERAHWPQVAQALAATHKPTLPSPPPVAPPPSIGPAHATAPRDAAGLIRQRRSAQRMDGESTMAFADFERTLACTLPRADTPPFDAWPYEPAINLLLFVHRVDGLEPGLYLLNRTPQRFDALREACETEQLAWDSVENASLPLYRLAAPADVRKIASQFCCYQGISGRGAFSLGMLADIARVLDAEGAWAYRRLHWEAGMIGQVLYLEAEASGLRGTGIGCFFDDEVHHLLGLGSAANASWQTLYHFTIGGPMDDQRLGTEPAYGHLGPRPPLGDG
ncbi:SagB/ThcOx family dehydrogenase [Thiosocius teredinicola]|uniref:SagB/ThcOx family dehydrogenase n=1 Tax=Thiosocius teredinicola TaxID=1973002 RepID=UPI000990E896